MPTASVLARLSALSHAQGPCWLSCGQGTVGVARLGCRRLSSLSAKWQCHGCGPRAETKGVPAQGYGPLQPRARMPAPTVLRFGRTSSRPLALNPTPGCQREGKPEPVLRSSEETAELSTACGAPGLVRQACLAHAELDARATRLHVDSSQVSCVHLHGTVTVLTYPPRTPAATPATGLSRSRPPSPRARPLSSGQGPLACGTDGNFPVAGNREPLGGAAQSHPAARPLPPSLPALCRAVPALATWGHFPKGFAKKTFTQGFKYRATSTQTTSSSTIRVSLPASLKAQQVLKGGS